VIPKPAVAALAVALFLGALVLSGCSSATQGSVASPEPTVAADMTTSQVATGTQAVTTGTVDTGSDSAAASGATSGGKSSNITGADLAAIKKQLDAMQKELDNLSMPSDNDFSGAEGAVY